MSVFGTPMLVILFWWVCYLGSVGLVPALCFLGGSGIGGAWLVVLAMVIFRGSFIMAQYCFDWCIGGLYLACGGSFLVHHSSSFGAICLLACATWVSSFFCGYVCFCR